jgi:NAD(P)-dependent dehydrogenase (short-subunit alcohol dehydrogenase family)
MTDGGSVVNVASIAGVRGTERVHYSASKAAVLGLTNTMAAQHGPRGVRVNAVVPGSVWTPFVERLTANPAQRDELRARRTSTNMLRAEGTGWDVAYAILFLASDESRWITSQALVVDGGQTKQLAD